MKTTLRTLFVGILLATTSIASAQQVNTLYFLENAPMRHTINPAFQPASIFYLEFPVIGYTSLWAGTNSWTISDFLFKGPQGNTITPLHPDAKNWLDSKPNSFVLEADAYLNLFSMGWAIRDFGYFHLNISERIMSDAGFSSSLFQINDLSSGSIMPFSVHLNTLAYTDVAVGYSHKINDKWTVGGKLKFLIGQANLHANLKDVTLSTSMDSLHLAGNGEIYAGASLRWNKLPTNPDDFDDFDIITLLADEHATATDIIKEVLKPAGMGAALDLGFTYKPIKNLQLTASVTDLGFIHWTRNARASMSIDTTFTGVDMDFGDYGSLDGFDSDSLMSSLISPLGGYSNAIHIDEIDNEPSPHTNMIITNLNVGIDANFWKNRIGIGVYSRTRFYNNHISEEVTLGAALRPCNWFNLAASYSFINGRWSNIGAALTLAPYDGLMLTLATDYIPTTYAKAATSLGNVSLPYKTPGFNVAFGIAIVAGTNYKGKKVKDKDKDGIYDKLDLCPNTPLNVEVDANGCPLDTDGDGVADYLDNCPETPAEAYGMIDEQGCPLDTDGDSIPDYLDQCPDTPAEAFGMIDSLGCPLDTDQDGVYDYLDQCPDTPAEAYGMVDSVGCPIDTDGDSIFDYLDQCPHTAAEDINYVDSTGCFMDADGDGINDQQDLCPDTPREAYGTVDASGCPIDSDQDGVYDYLDQCPDTPVEAINHVDSMGCPLDTDKDGVADYCDSCKNTTPDTRYYVNAVGCVLDSDNDGVFDYKDQCPNTPAEAVFYVDSVGCPLDTDKDGVADYCDSCKNTIAEARSQVDALGCALDTDSDGIFDYEDLCPTIAGVKENKGCPGVQREVRNILNKAMSGIEFENGRATIKISSHPILNEIAQIFIQNPTYKVEIQGHTDNVGKYHYNMELSDRRARAVRAYLISKGVPAARLTAHGYGPDLPIADNNTSEGRAKNRRVEFQITFEEITYETVYDRAQDIN